MAILILPPWPPADPGLLLPYDQRGCCFPWGPYGFRVREQLRYCVKATSTGGDLDPAWFPLSIGQVFIMRPDLSYFFNSVFKPDPTWPHLVATLQIGSPDEDVAAWTGNVSWQNTGFASLDADGPLPLGTPAETPFNLPVSLAIGPAPLPDLITITSRLWYKSFPSCLWPPP